MNIEDKAQIDQVDIGSRTVTRSWSLAPCKAPTGLAIDVEHHRLSSGCRSGVTAISDAEAGKLVTTVPIGEGVDATRFDPATLMAFASCGDGRITGRHPHAAGCACPGPGGLHRNRVSVDNCDPDHVGGSPALPIVGLPLSALPPTSCQST